MIKSPRTKRKCGTRIELFYWLVSIVKKQIWTYVFFSVKSSLALRVFLFSADALSRYKCLRMNKYYQLPKKSTYSMSCFNSLELVNITHRRFQAFQSYLPGTSSYDIPVISSVENVISVIDIFSWCPNNDYFEQWLVCTIDENTKYAWKVTRNITKSLFNICV